MWNVSLFFELNILGQMLKVYQLNRPDIWESFLRIRGTYMTNILIIGQKVITTRFVVILNHSENKTKSSL